NIFEYKALITEIKEAAQKVEQVFDNYQDFDPILNACTAVEETKLKKIQAMMKTNKVEHEKVMKEAGEKRDLINSMKYTFVERIKEIHPLVMCRMDTLEGVTSNLDVVVKEMNEKVDELTFDE
ncbi:hypothetical protein KI387_026078, partial [Taxus chinensis]